jgi:hypothetical protein
MYPTSLGFSGETRSHLVSDRCIQPALVFCDEIRSQVVSDQCIRPALDSPARPNHLLLVIVVFDRPWCFATRSDQIMVGQVSNEFLTGLEVLLNYLVICFESLYCVLQAVLA